MCENNPGNGNSDAELCDDPAQNEYSKIFKHSYSYWDNYLRTSAWFNHHRTFVEEFQRSSSFYEQWCRSQMAYHTQMANFFYSQWVNLQTTMASETGKAFSVGNKEKMNTLQSSPSRCSAVPELVSKKRSRSRKSSKRSRSRRNKRKSSRHSSCHIELHLDSHDLDNGQLDLIFDGNESTEFEMEITEEMLEFFKKSAKHRMERDSMKTKVGSRQDVYIELSEVTAGKNQATSEPPKEQPGQRRLAEMKELYGSGAAMIHGMETAMQLSFDRNLDRKQPRHWPALPINLSFCSTKRMGIFNAIKVALS